tara:strand:+ start:2875 stop:3147 length:273 start_codon:yes stop_codon:yes gene_type:complete
LKIIVTNLFLKFKKKSPKKIQLEIDNQIKKIVNNPEIGKIKKGNLTGIRIHKFTAGSQLLLLSYEYVKDVLYLYTIGSHENFYKKLKRFL